MMAEWSVKVHVAVRVRRDQRAKVAATEREVLLLDSTLYTYAPRV
jgi:hypothetical protein